MPGSEHFDTAVQATTSLKSGVPTDDAFTHQQWQEFERLVRALEDAVSKLHPATHASADAHAAHAQRTAQRVERRAAHAHQASEHVGTAASAVDQAHADLSQHEEGTESHAAAQAAHTDAQTAHAGAQAAHETARTRHADAQAAHEKATHHAQTSAHNKEHVNSLKTTTEELIAALELLLAATSQLGAEASHEARAEAKAQHQGTIATIRSHGDRLEQHLSQVHRDSLDEPEDDSAEDRD
jgi:hypothetical protein